MENLRWILIFAGVAILVLLYFSGRSPKSGRGQSTRAGRATSRGVDARDDQIAPHVDQGADPLLGEQNYGQDFEVFGDPHAGDLSTGNAEEYPGSGRLNAGRLDAGPLDSGRLDAPSPDDLGGFDDPDDFVRPAARRSESGRAADARSVAAGGLSSLSKKIEAFSDRLTPGRRQRVAESEPAETSEENSAAYASKIITLHVVSSPGSLLPGPDLLQVFENRAYHFGEMNIFHSMHHGKTVFSIAKMVEPGFFDLNAIDSFETPGITLILQLPGPVPADVAFEVLVSEAFEMANELNATVLDGDRSTLTKQTVQHLREGIYEYMHRQKYFGTVPS